jgi:endonuclease/exonuclease/phosphatase family metal-dependent hydrolase
MRIVSWNLAQRGRKTRAFLQSLGPDIALVQEAILPGEIPGYTKLWTPGWDNGTWGSAILSRIGEPELLWENNERGAVVLARCSIDGVGDVTIASLHARLGPNREGVIRPLRKTFEALRPRLGDCFIVGGDFNTARLLGRVYDKHWGHEEFWNEMDAWAWDVVFRKLGKEEQSFWRKGLRNELMDDHVLVDEKTFELVTHAYVLDTPEVRELSDHAPVVVDLAVSTE